MAENSDWLLFLRAGEICWPGGDQSSQALFRLCGCWLSFLTLTQPGRSLFCCPVASVGFSGTSSGLQGCGVRNIRCKSVLPVPLWSGCEARLVTRGSRQPGVMLSPMPLSVAGLGSGGHE